MKKISILIPCYNEEQSLPLLIAELDKVTNSLLDYDWEYLFVNDGSNDGTLNLLSAARNSNPRVNYVDLSRNYGKEVAMLAGFDYASGDCAIIMDADLQHPPYVIPQMIEKWNQGFDDVYAKRLSRGKESFLRKKLTMIYYRILSQNSKMDVLPNVGDFRLLDRKCIDALKQIREQGRYTKGMYCYIGFKKCGIEFETQDRVAGQSNMSYRTLLNLALEGLMSYTIKPLRIASFLGLIVAIVAFVYMSYVLIRTVILGDPVAGYPTMMVVILFLGGIQLLSLGIIGEYLGKTFIESKNRPTYFIQSYNGNN